MDLLDYMKQDMGVQRQLIKRYEKVLENLPTGGLNYRRSRGKICYYHVNRETGKRSYIGSKNQFLISQLKQRALLELAVKVMRCNLKLQENFLKKYINYSLEFLKEKLKAIYRDVDLQSLEDMCTESYVLEGNSTSQSPFKKELRHQTSFGLRVRSKSEVIIAELLHVAGIPFRYEPELIILDENGILQTYYPDFVIYTREGEKIYWEHLGLMNRPEYRQKLMKKLADYYHNNIISPVNLILPMDGEDGGLAVSAIERVIESFKPLCCRL